MKKILIVLITLAFSLGTVWAQDDSDDVQVPPRGKKGRITVITDPANSDVYLAGKLLGKSPIKEMEVPSGRHDLIIMDQGFQLVKERFNVWPDSVNVYEAKTVIPKGGIEVTTIPAKCNIMVDGENADFTDGGPLTIKNLDAGSHTVTAQCAGRTKEVLVDVKGEEVVKVEIDVKKR